MIFKRIIISAFIFFIFITKISADQIPDFTIMTEDWKPYQYEEDGQLKGIAVDLLVLIFKELGSLQGRDDIQMVPWARGYYTAQTIENTILFSTTRTPERENLFKWVGPIFQETTYLIGKKSRNIEIVQADQLLEYTIGTIYDDVGEIYLSRLGFPREKMQRTNHAENNVKMLSLDRIDLIVTGWTAFVHDAEHAGVDPDLYEPVYVADTSDLDFAFHISTPDSIVLKFQEAFDRIKKRGDLDALFTLYGEFIEN
ncbi:MAG: ABC transporter substrate-binding protein [Spirochaetaceae bacterium]|nr:ABC transporter substrate-binding protein [Spirochaetaceae bacterium]